jgi:hypothetical protein
MRSELEHLGLLPAAGSEEFMDHDESSFVMTDHVLQEQAVEFRASRRGETPDFFFG